jgi:hypothetical protein
MMEMMEGLEDEEGVFPDEITIGVSEADPVRETGVGVVDDVREGVWVAELVSDLSEVGFGSRVGVCDEVRVGEGVEKEAGVEEEEEEGLLVKGDKVEVGKGELEEWLLLKSQIS